MSCERAFFGKETTRERGGKENQTKLNEKEMENGIDKSKS